MSGTATWRSGYAAACKAVYTGSIPVVASRTRRRHRPHGAAASPVTDPIQSAAVFGGNSDIAVATVEALAHQGLRRVVLAVRDPERAPAAPVLRGRGLHVDVIRFDADDEPEQHERAVDEAFATLGPVDVALVAFGVLGDPDAAKRDPRAAVAIARTNFVGAVSVLTILGERMRAQGRGAIVLLSSIAAERARQANYPYGATKAGIDAFAQGLGDALAPAGVLVMVVRPGFVHTKMTVGRPAAPLSTDRATVADDIVAGLQRGAHIVWSPRQLRWVWACLRHLPRALFRRVRR
jgi:decaprenylphospho-beta-D-erythro-pentofuranosid-2-ulose 2-reductase